MKRIVYCSSMKPQVIEINIDVYFQAIELLDVSASKIRPILKPSGELDYDAYHDYDEFVYKVLAAFGWHRFEEVDIQFSNQSDTSVYMWFYPKNSDGSIADKYIIRLRISDHVERPSLKKSKNPKDKEKLLDLEKREQQYLQKYADEHKRPADKIGKQKYVPMEIVVNNETFEDYDDAFEAVDRLLDKIQSKYSK